MEVVSGIATVLQPVQFLVIESTIQSGQLSDSIKTLWRQTDIEGLLGGCQRTYERLSVIFAKIARQRSSAAAVRAYIRLKRYDGDITHLRLCINTYTSALQVPVLIQSITSTTQIQMEPVSEGQYVRLLEDLGKRIADLEDSMTRAQQDLMMRIRDRDRLSSTNLKSFDNLEDMLRGIKLEILHLKASQQSPQSKNVPTDSKEQTPQHGDDEASLDFHLGVEAADKNRAIETETDTRIMLDKTKQLVHHARSYASTLDAFSLSSRSAHLRSESKYKQPGKNGEAAFPLSELNIDFSIPDQQRQAVATWVADIDTDEVGSIVSMSSQMKSLAAPSITTMSQSTTGSTSLSTTSGHSPIGELHQRRLHTVQGFMKTKKFDKAIPRLVRLLENSDDPRDGDQKTFLVKLLAKALYETGPDSKQMRTLCEKFPEVRYTLDEFRLEQAQELIEQKSFSRVLELLERYRPGSSSWKIPDDEKCGNAASLIKLRLAYSTAMIQSGYLRHSIPCLDWLVEQESLQPIQKAEIRCSLAEAYCTSPKAYEKAKHHGMLAVQAYMDLLGRDHEFTLTCIVLMVYICYHTGDPDMDLWREMVPVGKESTIKPVPFPWGVDGGLRPCCFYMQLLAPRFESLAADLGVEYLRMNFTPPISIILQRRMHPCYECIRTHIVEGGNSLLVFKKGTKCEKHEVSETSSSTDSVVGLSLFQYLALSTLSTGGQRDSTSWVQMRELLAMAEPEMRDQLINADSDQPGSSLRTPLWLAAAHGQKETVDFLLSRQETRINDNTAAHTLIQKIQSLEELPPQTESIITAYNALSSTQAYEVLDVATDHDVLKRFKTPTLLSMLLKRFRDEDQSTQIKTAANVSVRLAQVFFTAAICSLRTVLTSSTLKQRKKFLKALKVCLKNGADPNFKDKNGLTAMDFLVSHLYEVLRAWRIGSMSTLGTERKQSAIMVDQFIHDLEIFQTLAADGCLISRQHKIALENILKCLPESDDLDTERELLNREHAYRTKFEFSVLPRRTFRKCRLWCSSKANSSHNYTDTRKLIDAEYKIMLEKDIGHKILINADMISLKGRLQSVLSQLYGDIKQ